ncbi:MAG: DUF31 family protein [Mycoplasmataceae bacterium]|nr:DUF31 family protein [Mycoplasmataceae bacterium]
MKIKKYLWALPLTIITPTIFLNVSCSFKEIEILFVDTQLYTDDTLLFSFQNVKKTDNITCTSEYDDQPTHYGYFSISPYDKKLNEIVLTRTDVQIDDEIKCPITFWNNGQLVQTIQITLPPTEIIDYSGYINDRTVSLMYYPDLSHITRGTGWIINKIDDQQTNNYRYWLATNFHVIASLPKTTALFYGSTDDTEGSQINYRTGYTSFTDFTIDKNLYSDTTTVTTGGITGNPGNDMVVIDVDFGSSPSGTMKAKLDKLNNEWTNSGETGKRHINTFANFNNYQLTGTYRWGGYPVQNCADVNLNNNSYAEWHTDEIFDAQEKVGGDTSKNYCHGIESNIYGSVVDVSPQIYSDYNKFDSKMGAGASGSMLIDHNKNIVGIYWGGLSQTSIFYPFFDIFNNSDFNYSGTPDTFLTNYMYS